MILDQSEIWKVIKRFPAYSISSLGRVRRDLPVFGGGGSFRAPSGILKQRSLPLGHMQVTICMGNKPKTVLVHRLVAEEFLEPPAGGLDCVCHRDDDPANNRPDNLFWGTRADNSADMVLKGRQARGQRVSGAKLNPTLVMAIKADANKGRKQRDIAAHFGVSQAAVSLVISGKTWGHVR